MIKPFYLLSLALALPFAFFTQEFTTGNVTLSSTSGSEMAVRIDIGAQVTLTMTGPSARWFSVGFNATSMASGTDVVTVRSASTLTDFDGKLTGFLAPSTDNSQDWTIVSDQVTGTSRTIVATRALNTSDADDYIFLAQTGNLNLIWARAGGASFSLSNHGSSNRGSVAVTFTEVQQSNLAELATSIDVFPNPITAGATITVPEQYNSTNYVLLDSNGKEVSKGTIEGGTIKIDARITPGNYMLCLPELILKEQIRID